MYPYSVDSVQQEQPPQPPAAAPQGTYRRTPSTLGRRGVAAMLALALLGGAAGGGAVVSVAASRWGAQPPSSGSTVVGQPVSAQGAAPANVVSQVFDQVSPAVVEIMTSGNTPMGSMESGGGTGFVVDADGLILTNFHVVAGAGAIQVEFADGTTREATLLGSDQGNDLALLDVDLPEGIPVVPLGDSDGVQVGETAIAIGSPFGLEQTVTQGIISAVQRTWWPGTGRAQRNLLQTDAPINPGNSGGPLLNARGEVIGVTSMIESPVRGSVGVGFAIPINTAKQLIPQLESGAALKPAWLGIRGGTLTTDMAEELGLPVDSGVLVTEIVPGGPADKAGLRAAEGNGQEAPRGGDVIVAVNGAAVEEMTALSDAISQHQPGAKITLTIIRDGEEQQIEVPREAWNDSTS